MRKRTMYLLLTVINIYMIICLHSYSQTAMFGNNPQHTGVYDSNLPTDLILAKKWKYKTKGMIFSSPVVFNNIIYFGSDDSCLYALDTLGHEKWKFKSDGIIHSAPAVKDTIVYISTYGGSIYAINTNTGLQEWNYKTNGEEHFSKKGLFGWTPSDSLMADPWDYYTSSPVITDTIIYFGSGKNVYAINCEKGIEVWKYLANDVVHTSPSVKNGKVFFGGWSGKFYALNALDGSESWIYETGTDGSHLMQGIQSSPTIVDTIVVFGSRDANVYALDLNTGNKIWSTGFGSSWMPSSLAYYNGTLFTGSSEGGGLKAIDIATGSVRFTASKGFYFTFSSPAIASETAFIGCMNGSLFAVDVNTGIIKYRFDTDGRILDPMDAILDDGTLNPSVFNPVSGYPYSQAVEYVRRLLTAGSIASTPVIANNTIYFGSSDSCFYAVYDDGRCRADFEVSTGSIDIGVTTDEIVDTVFYIKNIGDCSDSVEVYVTKANASLIKSFIIQPTRFEMLPGDSVKVKISLNTSDLISDKSYGVTLVSQSTSNEYKFLNTLFNFTTPVISGISQIDKTQSDNIFPNPFSESVIIKYSLEHDYFVDIRIYNSSGQLKKILTSQNQTIGDYQVTWDGTDTKGIKLNNGLYFCTIKKGSIILNKKVMFLNGY